MGKNVGGGVTAFEVILAKIEDDYQRLKDALASGNTIVMENVRFMQGQIHGLEVARTYIEDIAKQYEEQ